MLKEKFAEHQNYIVNFRFTDKQFMVIAFDEEKENLPYLQGVVTLTADNSDFIMSDKSLIKKLMSWELGIKKNGRCELIKTESAVK